MAHAAAWGDIDNDGDIDLYVGSFCDRPAQRYKGRASPVPNILLINENGSFRQSPQQTIALKARTSGAAFVDLDNDGDLDLYVSNNSKSRGLRVANKLFENINGYFRDVSEDSAACVIMGGRSVGVLDFDGDGLLDLLVAEDKWTGRRTRLFKNLGKMKFEDYSVKAGLPENLPGLGVITPDLNEDGWPDIFVSQANRLFLSRQNGTYHEAGSDFFQYEPINREATPCGVAFGDVNRDSKMDIVIVDHSQPACQHLFINLGLCDGVPQFRQITKDVGLYYKFPSWTSDGFHLKHAHVEIADFDNDGWPDILVAATYRMNGQSWPFICRNVSSSAGAVRDSTASKVRFQIPPVEKADTYFPSGPTMDFNRDGKLDVFLASWYPEISSRLFLNNSPSNHWLRIKVVGKTINKMGIGAKVKVYSAGKLGQGEALLGYQEIAIGIGFCSEQEAIAHFGLGSAAVCDLEVILPYGKGNIRRKNVRANQLLIVNEP
ncbi:MAG: CRTAC1 family protein [Sedimentisphaerales bacterium]